MKLLLSLSSLGLLALLNAGCASIDPEYSQKVTQARTDWKGDEITGVWVSRFKNWANNNRNTLLLRADGTGIFRIKGPGAPNGKEWNVTWSYSGNGTWTGRGQARMILRYTGHELLVETSNEVGVGFYYVFVPGGDSTAVNAHLRAR